MEAGCGLCELVCVFLLAQSILLKALWHVFDTPGLVQGTWPSHTVAFPHVWPSHTHKGMCVGLPTLTRVPGSEFAPAELCWHGDLGGHGEEGEKEIGGRRFELGRKRAAGVPGGG